MRGHEDELCPSRGIETCDGFHPSGLFLIEINRKVWKTYYSEQYIKANQSASIVYVSYIRELAYSA